MNQVLQATYVAFRALMGAGAIVILPIIITIVGLIVRLKFSKALKAGLTVAIGFAGINLVINLLSTNLGPAAKAMVQNFGIKLDILDVGWGAIAAVTWSSPIIPILIGVIFLTNIILLVLRASDTLDVDIWNYHHMAIVGVMVYFVTNNLLYASLAALFMAIITFKLSDWSAPLVEKYFGLPSISLPTMSALSSLLIAVPMNWLLDKIPGVNKINFSIKDAQKKFGIFGEPIMLGFLLGAVIGLLARYPLDKVLSLAVYMAAVLVLIPKMTSLFVEGLMPISEAATKFTQKRFKGRKFLIGLDAAVIVGDQSVITTALIVTPITILMAAILPGNRVLPFADLAVITFRVALIVALCNGNLFKSIIIGIFTTGAILLAGTATSPVLTALAKSTGLNLANGSQISCFAATSLSVSYLVYEVFVSNVLITLPILIVVLAACWYYFGHVRKLRGIMEEAS